jgi:transcription antitermination factor NusG
MQADSLNSRWYAIRTQVRFEKVVREQLVNRGIETLLPSCKRMSQWKNRTKVIEAALFPEYCFARLSATQRQVVLQIPGVLEILDAGNKSESVIAEEIAAVQTLVRNSISYDAQPDVEEGVTVEVIRGPLAGTRGKYLRQGGRSRFVIPISLIGKAVGVAIERDDVRDIAAGNLSTS